MDYDEHIAAAQEAVAAIADVLRTGPIDARVPTCPDWALADLAEHVVNFSGFWCHVLCEASGRPKTPFRELAKGSDGEEAASLFEELAGNLIGQLRATPPDTEVWTWVPDQQTARFVARRMAHELAVHRFDAQTSRGAPQPIDAVLAADGIEEIFVMCAAWEVPAGRGQGETLHFHGTDQGDEWFVTLTPDGLAVDRRHAKADLALRGAVSDLELLMYHRPPLGEVEHHGDEAVLDAWYRGFTFG